VGRQGTVMGRKKSHNGDRGRGQGGEILAGWGWGELHPSPPRAGAIFKTN